MEPTRVEQAVISLERLDHLGLTVRDVAATIEFYRQALGMEEIDFGEGRKALRFGQSKINLHQAGHEFEPKAEKPTPGSADLCFITATPLPEVIAHLQSLGIAVELGPVERTGALGKMQSIYLRDPDGNLLEISNYL